MLFSILFGCLIGLAASDDRPTLYSYYTGEKIAQGLSNIGIQFTLNGKNITIYSGSLHYFRVHPEYWRDRLRKMRAAGLNAVETYVPWNLHEPKPNQFDFGDKDNDFTPFLNITRFLEIAKEEDLFAIVRPGPYICGEWEFGGLPSWLLRNDQMKLRTNDTAYLSQVKRYFDILIPKLARQQFIRGGPIIAMQIENEYGNTKNLDKEYLKAVKDMLTRNGITELLFTSDTQTESRDLGALPDVLQTSNFPFWPQFQFNILKNLQPGKPFMAMEFWTGWFDHWSEKHHTRSTDSFGKVLEDILKYPGSVNMYMFLGGTDFGFMNGANINLKSPFPDSTTDNELFQPDTTSYDYDAPLTETGDYGEKYFKAKEVIEKYNKVDVQMPEMPPESKKLAYPNMKITEMMNYNDIYEEIGTRIFSKDLLAMEQLAINSNGGQSYGYIIYRKEQLDIAPNSKLQIDGRVCDSVMVLINGKLVSKALNSSEDLNGFGYWRQQNSTLNLGSNAYKNSTLELVVENWGRVNFGLLPQLRQYKGLWQGPVRINGEALEDWMIKPFQMEGKWMKKLRSWTNVTQDSYGPAFYRGNFTANEKADTFIDMREWTKGVVFINGFNLGRYCLLGPQQTLYLPAPMLNIGSNEIIVFEQFKPAINVKFTSAHIFETK